MSVRERSMAGVFTLAILTWAEMSNAGTFAGADFTGGNGTTSSDQWTGLSTGGDGWSNAWSFGENQISMATGSVVATAPLAGGGNYLSVVNQPNASSIGRQAHITRDIAFGSLDPRQINSVSFMTRLDERSGGATADFLSFYDHENTGSYLNAPHVSWRVNLDGTGFWEAYSGTAINPVVSQVARIVGDTYAVSLSLDYTVAGTYSATFTNLDWEAGDAGLATDTLSGLLLKSAAGFGPEFAFGARVFETASVTNRTVYSVDAIRIGAVPEPGMGILAFAGAALVAGRRRRGRQGR